MRQEHDEIEIDLREIFYVLKKKLVLIMAITIVFGAAAGLYSYYKIAPQYSSTAKIYVMSKAESTLSFSDLNLSSGLASDYMELIKSRSVLEPVIQELGLDLSYEDLAKNVSVTNPTDTRMLAITVKYTDALIAQKMADSIVAESQEAIARVMKTDEPTIVEEASFDEKKVYPSNSKYAIIAAMLGLLLSAGTIVVLYIANDRVKTVEDIERYLGLETLAAIPNDMDGKPQKKSVRQRFRLSRNEG